MRLGLEHPSGENLHDSGLFKDTADDELLNGDKEAVPAPIIGEDNAENSGNGDRVEASYRKSLEPHGSMEFESKEDAFKFYKEYAISVGFSAIIKASRRSRMSGTFIDAKFVCARYGSKRGSENSPPTLSIPAKKKRGRINRSWSKTDCKACMHIKRRQDGRWIISSFVGEHNHDLVLDDVETCRPDVYAQSAVQIRKKKVSILTRKMHNESIGSSSNASGLGFREGDVKAMLEYISCMQDENPYFFYAIDLNKEQVLRNIFWVDPKGRIDYGNFGDAVLFDTTYRENESRLPFVPFIGMNNHFKLVLFGCALLSDETKASYSWLMRAWVRSMHGQAPKVILTDQDSVLKEAIAEVLPDSRHCFCLWHILSKIQEKLGYVIRQHENFINKFYKCVLRSQTEEQFEKRWWKMVDRFELRTDKWMKSLYDDRVRWVPVYMKDIFLAGLSSPQRLESVVSLLDKCLLRKTSLKEFLHQYNVMLLARCEDEAKADFDSWHRQPLLKSPSPYGKQMATMYTHVVFKRFQVEVLGVVACHPKIESEDGPTKSFKVHDFEDNQVYKVTWNENTCDTSCTCRMFEYNGFLCRHVMIILQISGVNNIPRKYILKRWTKDAKNREAPRQGGLIESWNQRYNDLCQRACKLGDEGSLCQETYCIAYTALEEAIRKCKSIHSSVQTVSGRSSPSNYALHESEVLTRGVLGAGGNNNGGALLGSNGAFEFSSIDP